MLKKTKNVEKPYERKTLNKMSKTTKNKKMLKNR